MAQTHKIDLGANVVPSAKRPGGGAKFESSTAPETIDLNQLLSFRFPSLTDDQEAGEDPIKPHRTR